MSFLDSIYEWLGGKPRSKEWYQQELGKLLIRYERIKKELDDVDSKQTVSQVADTINERITNVGKLATRATKLRADQTILELQITQMLRKMKECEYIIPPEYFRDYPDLVNIRRNVK
ncbi:hypothetical protein HYX00_00205 [Candidatus Woesearchaeota archaeon]|nr:hypothetical protein [Candidatus Woesearchaeota archaeon]